VRSAGLETTKRKKDEVGSGSQKERIDEQKPNGNKLTFNLLLLHLEGPTRLLSLLPQLEERGPLLLEGLALVFMRNAELH
jgi:hypothetical protein